MNNNLHLGERLKLQIQSEQETLDSQTSDALNKHRESLKLLSSDALNTMKSVIRSENDLLLQSINSSRRALWIAMLSPVLLTILLCTLIAMMTWMWLPTALFEAQTVKKEMPDGKTYTLIVDPGWTTCEVNKKSFPCLAE